VERAGKARQANPNRVAPEGQRRRGGAGGAAPEGPDLDAL